MRFKYHLVASILSLTIVISQAEESNGWSWKPIVDETQVDPNTQDESYAETTHLDSIYNEANDTVAIDEVIDNILISGRQGRNLEGLDEVYADPDVKQALDGGDDVKARSLIRNKLCDLGLMQCDEERKRPYLSPEDLIYAQPVDIKPIGRPIASIPVRGPPKAYGLPKPVPLPHKPHNGPPRKVGYGGPYKPTFLPNRYGAPGGPNQFNSQAVQSNFGANFADIPNEFNSKPPGFFSGGAPSYGSGPFYENTPIEAESPYQFEPPSKHVLNKQEHVSSAVDIIPSVQQHVHHHYHHGENEKTVIVKPIPVGGYAHSSGGEGALKEISNYNNFNNGGFSPMTSGFGINSVSSQETYNGANGVKPVYEPSQQNLSPGVYKSPDNNLQNQFGLYGNGELNNGYGNGGYQNYQNPQNNYDNSNNFYKKELNTAGTNNNNIDPSEFAATTVYNRFTDASNLESGRAQAFDCVCVPYDQCQNQDIIGRKDDLFLPIDPRNLKSDIEALPEENVVVTDGNGTMTVVRVSKSAENITEVSDSITEISQEKEEVKKISKREVSETNKGQEKSEIEPRLIIGSGGNGGGTNNEKRVQPTFGISFGLPQGGYGGYPLNPFGPNPVVNPYGPAINGGGLNLGLISVNPLVALQVTKDDYGEKVIKPLVNLHVTPNEHFVNKIGQLFHEKKHQFFNTHQHYHHHKFPPPPPYQGNYGPSVYAPHHFSSYKPYYHSEYSNPSSVYPSTGYIDSYKSEDDYDYGDDDYQGNYQNEGVELNTYSNFGGDLYGRALNNSIKRARSRQFTPQQNNYAQNYNSYFRDLKVAEPSAGVNREEERTVRFPNNRRRRDLQIEDSSKIDSTNITEARYVIAKRQAFYGQQNRCGARQVCCRRNNNLQRPPTNRGQCGTRHSQGINGRIKTPVYEDGDSEFGEYPWQVAILKKDPKESVYVCGGTLIDNYHIITAAHCVKSYNGFDLRVRLGEWDVNHDVEFYPYIERNVVSVHVHPQYYAGTLDNDLAILKMEHAVDWTKYPHISPACLPDKFTDYSGQRCWTTGWGKDAFGDYGKYQNILKEVDVPVIPHYQCEAQLRQTRLGYSYKLNPGFVCAGGEEGKDACKGDGGGPMVCEKGGTWQLVGVVSWGIGCGQVNVPGVYVKVAHYLDWLAQITGRFG